MKNRPGTVDELTTLYRETIVRHAVAPVGFEAPVNATHQHEIYNPLCGDRIEMLIELEGDIINAIAFRGEACAICLASASLLCGNQAPGPVTELKAAHAWLEGQLLGGADHPQIEALRPLLGVRAFPSRVKCALLPWEAAREALAKD